MFELFGFINSLYTILMQKNEDQKRIFKNKLPAMNKILLKC